MGYYAFGNFWVCQKKITIYSLFGSPCTTTFQDYVWHKSCLSVSFILVSEIGNLIQGNCLSLRDFRDILSLVQVWVDKEAAYCAWPRGSPSRFREIVFNQKYLISNFKKYISGILFHQFKCGLIKKPPIVHGPEEVQVSVAVVVHPRVAHQVGQPEVEKKKIKR